MSTRRLAVSVWAMRVVKRLFDLVVCTVLVLLIWPVLAAIAVVVKLTSAGPVFFFQDRVGSGEKTFTMLKFRTMTTSSQPSLHWTDAEEARVTWPGHFIRDYGLDELPQLWNIIRGDMSVVGPRPPLPAQLPSYTKHERRAFDVKPGVLSLAVIKGRRSLTVSERRYWHAWYAENWSLWLDVCILWKSLSVVMRRADAKERIKG